MTRRTTLIVASLAASLIGLSSLLGSADILIWNRTASAPIGLYWKSDDPLTLNGWAVVSAESSAAIWASEHGFAGTDWPLIKRVRGLSRDTVCRDGSRILINGAEAAQALERDEAGRNLPRWQGCRTLGAHEVFLLNDDPRSLDGRYFGVTNLNDITGSATLLWAWR